MATNFEDIVRNRKTAVIFIIVLWFTLLPVFQFMYCGSTYYPETRSSIEKSIGPTLFDRSAVELQCPRRLAEVFPFGFFGELYSTEEWMAALTFAATIFLTGPGNFILELSAGSSGFLSVSIFGIIAFVFSLLYWGILVYFIWHSRYAPRKWLYIFFFFLVFLTILAARGVVLNTGLSS